MRISRLLLPFSIAILLAGCQSLTPEQQRAADESRCLGYGFRRGTEGFAACLQNIDLDRQAEARAFRYQSMSNLYWNQPVIYVRPNYYRRH